MWARISQFKDQCDNQNTLFNLKMFIFESMDLWTAMVVYFPIRNHQKKTKQKNTDCKVCGLDII